MLTLSEKYMVSGIPVSFIERYRSADGPALKVALYLFFGNSADVDNMAQELSLPVSAIERSLRFWLKAGMLAEKDTKNPEKENKPSKNADFPIEERHLSVIKVTEMLRNPDVAALMQESQSYLGRTLSKNESDRLLCIYEYDELPVEVILMIVAYSKKRAKKNLIGYIERTAREWKECEIDNSDKAERYLGLLDMREKRYNMVAEQLETDPATMKYREKQYIDQWFEEFGFDCVFVEEARLQSGNSSIAYLNKILRSWSQKGYKTIKDTRQESSAPAIPVPKRRKKGSGEDLFLRAVSEPEYSITTKNK